MEASMAARLLSLCLLAALLATSASAKDKKKSSLPDYVLKASTVLVVIEPEVGDQIGEQSANATAGENVEKALFEGGRLHQAVSGQQSSRSFRVGTGPRSD